MVFLFNSDAVLRHARGQNAIMLWSRMSLYSVLAVVLAGAHIQCVMSGLSEDEIVACSVEEERCRERHYSSRSSIAKGNSGCGHCKFIASSC